MPLKVIGAGFGRTGTNSLKIALEKLESKPCHHMIEVFANEDQVNWFYDKSNGKTVNWDEVYENFGAAVDWPTSAYYKELADYYPDSKIVLSVRNADSWYESTRNTIFIISTAVPWWMLILSPKKRKVFQMINNTIWQGVFSGRFKDRQYAIDIFNQHIEEVKAAIPEHRLLIHEAKEGWKPLCEFLGKPIPDEPYPRVNEAIGFAKQIKKLRIIRALPWVLLVIISLLIFYFN